MRRRRKHTVSSTIHSSRWVGLITRGSFVYSAPNSNTGHTQTCTHSQELKEMFDSHQRQNEEWVERIREENDTTRKELAEQRVGGPYYSNITSLPLTG